MAEPLKNIYSAEVIGQIGDELARIDGFDRARFDQIALDNLDALELMQRSAQITAGTRAALPPMAFPERLAALTGLLHPETENPLDDMKLDGRGLRGWAVAPIGTLVAEDGLEHPEDSLTFLREMTMRFSSEFAVRPFYRDHAELTLACTRDWAQDANFHVRRLASEGCRPRLPWGIRLQTFVKDPAPLLPILETLRDDPSEYVRRSVANNLNDISKDHPDLVTDLAADWLTEAPKPRARLVKHALRGLIKAGHPGALAAIGYGAPDGVTATFNVTPDVIVLGEALTLTLDLTSPARLPALIDFAVHFRRANGTLSPKVFKWTEAVLQPGTATRFEKQMPLRAVTTRKHYPGAHAVSVQVNGVTLAEVPFELKILS